MWSSWKNHILIDLQKVFGMTNPWFDKILRDGDIFYHFMKSEKTVPQLFSQWLFCLFSLCTEQLILWRLQKLVLKFPHLCTRTGTETRNWKHLLMALFLFRRQIPLAWSSYNPLPIYKSHSFTNKRGKCNYSDNFSSTYLLNWLMV